MPCQGCDGWVESGGTRPQQQYTQLYGVGDEGAMGGKEVLFGLAIVGLIMLDRWANKRKR